MPSFERRSMRSILHGMSGEPLDEPSGLSEPEEPPPNKPSLGKRLRAWLRRLMGR